MKSNYNIRQMQAYAAACLVVFCNHAGIKHDSVNQLIRHLLAMLTAISLPDWEQEGTKLDLTGRGDPLPTGIEETLKEEHREVFNSLVESCVEVGIVDMYLAGSDQPGYFLDKCVKIIRQFGLELPPVESLKRLRKGEGPWGEAIDEAELKEFLDEIGFHLI